MANSTADSLDLYAKVEDLLGVKEAAPSLYAHYLLFLNTAHFETLLDVGCGSGDFLYQMQQALGIPKVKGIDLSPVMVAKSLEQGLDAECIDLCALEAKFDVITAVFDMLNYLDKDNLKRFLSCVAAHLNVGGVFLCDINTLYGFENVAVGSYIVDDDTRFLTVDSDFDDPEYSSEFTLFENAGKGMDGCYTKSQAQIKQYYYSVEEIVRLSGLKLFVNDDVNLYGFEEADKRFIVLGKV
ncbi:class I SAM-dependent methyltransferase [Sulfurovum sp.]|uniref:class I SAM-dependent methyltransferase n=1 Tax=Sulfurovum sp. TaxID=1969726 RepID=UPI002867B39E|nr:class I SAM-dependent methyltransferase [Sulfurovum sp.]